MGKTLVVAEKPSVARDLAAALPGSFPQSKDKTHLVGDDHVITWAVGHPVGLAEPDAYDPKLKKWRFADLPIIPDQFKLVPNDDRSAKQLRAIHKLMADDEIDPVVMGTMSFRFAGQLNLRFGPQPTLVPAMVFIVAGLLLLAR